MLYEPREDSDLLAKNVEQLACGSVIDVGTGTGIQALAASRNTDVANVIATDINPQAVNEARRNGVKAFEADMFIDDTEYDTIISNAPYLPNDPRITDVALDGGRKGYEWTLRFLSESKSRLTPNGQILLLISTLTNTHVVEEHLLTQAYHYEIIDQEEHFQETLLVYRITHAIPKHPDATYLAKGKRSRVYKVGEDVIKIADPRRVAQETLMLKKVNALGLGPQLRDCAKGSIRMEYVAGKRIQEYLKQATNKQAQRVVAEIRRQAQLLDTAGIEKQELTNPYKHIIVTADHEIIQIDWERAKPSTNPRNLNQINEYIRKLRENHGLI